MMIQRKHLMHVVAIGWLCLPTVASAAGYGLAEQGAAYIAKGGTGVASTLDASALYFNPAQITRLPGTQLYLGTTLLTPTTSFAGVDPYPGFGVTESSKARQFFPPHAYVTHNYGNHWAVGAGVNAPFGLGLEWKDPAHFTGRYISTLAELSALNGMVSAAYAFDPQWSFAAGANAIFAKVKLENRKLAVVPGGGGAQVDVAKTRLESDFESGFGWNAGLSFTPTKQLALGACYRSKVVTHIDDARATITQIPTGDPAFDAAVAAGLPPSQTVGTVLRFPATWSAGVAWLPRETLTLAADFNFIEWSVFRDLPIRFKTTPSANQTVIEDYDDSWQVRLGVEHRATACSYRLGYYYDHSPVPSKSVSPILPDASRNGVSAGLGFGLGAARRMTLDLYELAVFFDKRSTEHVERDGYDGTYKSFANSAGVSLGYHW